MSTTNTCGGYRTHHSFQLASIVHLGTLEFCRRHLDGREEDPFGTCASQLIESSRAGKRSIVESSERVKATAKTQITFLGIARAHLSNFQCELEHHLASRGDAPWSVHSKDHQAMSAIRLDPFKPTDDLLHEHGKYLLEQKRKFASWLDHRDAGVVINALILLAQWTQTSISALIEISERSLETTRDRGKERNPTPRLIANPEDAPQCPQCGEAMRQRNSQKGPFWGCSTYPDCRGTRAV